MYQLVESIKCLDGELVNLRYHQHRFNLSRNVHFGRLREIKLSEAVIVPEEYKSGLFKCRVLYSKDIEKVEFLQYRFHKTESLKLVEDNGIEYRYKYTDRFNLERLFGQRGNCDDILIVKNGNISDSFTANVIFYDGNTWWTPDTPLLEGTQRARLIREKKIQVCRIIPEDLSKYKAASLINAMQDMDSMPSIKISRII